MDTRKLIDGLTKLGIPDNEISSICHKMESYIHEIILFNSAYNLTNTSDEQELVVRHVLDSLSPYQIIKKICTNLSTKQDKVCIADIGSGGGFPGIPLASVFPQYTFFLVERMSKRCAFLENCVAILDLKNVKVVNKEAEKVAKESFDISVFRAFRPLDEKMTKTLLNTIHEDGFLLAYKAKIENIKNEMEGVANIVSSYEIENLQVPFLDDSERNLVIIKK